MSERREGGLRRMPVERLDELEDRVTPDRVTPDRVTPDRVTPDRVDDWVAVEEPLAILLEGEPFAVTMRTPGADRELVAGFLFAEGVVRSPEEIERLEEIEDEPQSSARGNRIAVSLSASALRRREEEGVVPRSLRVTSACGVCGRPSLEDLWSRIPAVRPLAVDAALLRRLPDELRRRQRLFERTGGVHAAGLFDPDGRCLVVHEDVGRHNAVDKVVGEAFLAGQTPLRERILVVSGRAGFEIVQKALMAAVPVIVAVGAASSLAVEVASLGGLELYAFVAGKGGHRHVPFEERITVSRTET